MENQHDQGPHPYLKHLRWHSAAYENENIPTFYPRKGVAIIFWESEIYT